MTSKIGRPSLAGKLGIKALPIEVQKEIANDPRTIPLIVAAFNVSESTVSNLRRKFPPAEPRQKEITRRDIKNWMTPISGGRVLTIGEWIRELKRKNELELRLAKAFDDAR